MGETGNLKITAPLFTLRTKLVFLFLALTLVPLVIIGGFSINTTEGLIKSMVLRQLENIAADKAVILERWLNERKQDLQVVAGTSMLQSMDVERITPYLDLIQKHYGVYKNMTVISAANEVIVSTSTGYGSIASGRWDNGSSREGPLLSNIVFLSDEKESIFNIAAPIFNTDQQVGMVYGTVGTNSIIYTILSVSLGKTGEAYLVDSNGTFLAHKEPERILSENISQSASFTNIFGNRDHTKTYLDYRGIEVLGTFQKVGGTDWYIVVEQDRDEAFQSVEKLKRSIYLTLLLAAGSALVLTWVISHLVVRPIRALSHSAHALASTNHTPFDPNGFETDRRDEIGVLCRAFTDMAFKIGERQNNLETQFNLKEAELKETGHTLKRFKRIAEQSQKFAALGRLGAAVAHEIRTPLTSLKLFLESVEDEIEISSEYTEDFNVAMGQITRIETAINRLLDYTKPKDLFFSEIDIDRLLNDVVVIIKPLANKQECTIEIDIHSPLPKIDADKKLIEEALINLLINALEAMTESGRITVSAMLDRIDAGEGIGSQYIRIDIKDTGQGIPSEQIDSIFEPFYTTKSSGSGLGLPLVLNTIKRHNGEIQIQSHLSIGTVFSLFLPTKSAKLDAYGKDINYR